MSEPVGGARRAVAAVAAVLEYWLTSSPVRFDKDARRVVFQFTLEEPLALSFVPAAQGPLIKEGAVEGAAVTVRTHPEALLRILLEPDADPSSFPFAVEGDPSALAPIARALASHAGAKNAIDLRAQGGAS